MDNLIVHECWQSQNEGCSLPRCADYIHLSTVFLDQPTANRQPKSESVLFGRKKGVKNLVNYFRFNSFTRIRNLYDHIVEIFISYDIFFGLNIQQSQFLFAGAYIKFSPV